MGSWVWGLRIQLSRVLGAQTCRLEFNPSIHTKNSSSHTGKAEAGGSLGPDRPPSQPDRPPNS